jgi:TldD protein
MIESSTRREFLRTGSLALAGTVCGARALQAGVPVRIAPHTPHAAASFLVSASSPAVLKILASSAMDAARRAGASYADVRVAHRDVLSCERDPKVSLQSYCAYGVRAQVNGAWGFAYGLSPSVDAAVQCAQQAVSAARTSAKLSTRFTVEPATIDHDHWTPPPVVTGEWHMPVQVDPFAVPIQQQIELLEAIHWTIERIPGAAGGIVADWSRETRVVAATTGTLVTQHRYLADVRSNCIVRYGRNGVWVLVPGIQCTPTGYELLLAPDLQDRCKAATEDAVEFSRVPMRPLDIGRYPVVFDGYSMARVLTNLVGPSAELDRVLGHDVDASGTSRWSLDRLGTPVASPLMTVSGHRTIPEALNAAPWDDEGSVPHPHTIIRDGILVDYHTTSQTVPALARWYAQQGKQLQSNGCAVAPTADMAVNVRPAHLTMTAGGVGTSLQDLYKDMTRGLLVLQCGWIAPDQQLSSGSIDSTEMLFEIARGKIVRRLTDSVLQFRTVPLLEGLTAIGDRTTLRYRDSYLTKGIPWQTTRQSATAPAAFFRSVDVISPGRV